MMYLKNYGFTIVELVVALTIMAVLATIAMISYFSFVSDSRDSVRVTDMHNLVSLISISEAKIWEFPVVSNPIEILFEGDEIWKEGVFGQESLEDVRTITEIPKDPLTGEYYNYSLSWRAWEFQITWIREESIELSINPFISQASANSTTFDYESSIVRGTYNGKFLTHSKRISALENEVYILGLPSITSRSIESVEVNELIEDQDLVYDASTAIAWSYNRDSSISDEKWNFQPSTTEHGALHNAKVVVYAGTNTELSTEEGKQDLLKSLQKYYEGTNIEGSEVINDLVHTPLWEAEITIDAFIDSKIGGLHNARIPQN